MKKMEGLDVGWGDVGEKPREWWRCGDGHLREDGDDSSCVTGRSKPIPVSLSRICSILSSAAQPLPPRKLSSVLIGGHHIM